jgi:hypothetical protein
LLQHVEELRERARLRRDEAAARQLAHGFGEEVAQRYHSEAAQLEMVASVVSCAVHLVRAEEPVPEPAHRVGDRPLKWADPPKQARVTGLPLRPKYSVPHKICPLCGAKLHWKDGGSTNNPGRKSVRDCGWRQWAVDVGLVARDDFSAALPENTTENELAFTEWLRQHPGLEAGSIPAERRLRQQGRAKRQT